MIFPFLQSIAYRAGGGRVSEYVSGGKNNKTNFIVIFLFIKVWFQPPLSFRHKQMTLESRQTAPNAPSICNKHLLCDTNIHTKNSRKYYIR